jgi:hypothetical protein
MFDLIDWVWIACQALGIGSTPNLNSDLIPDLIPDLTIDLIPDEIIDWGLGLIYNLIPDFSFNCFHGLYDTRFVL